MGILDSVVDIAQLGQRNLWVIYGKSGTGKTELASTFPKPLLYIQIGDDGSNTIAGKEGIKALRINDLSQLREALYELRLDTTYKTVVIDTFSLVVNEWIDQNAVQKKKKVSMQMWGEIKADTEELIKSAHIIAQSKNVVLTCHEVMDSIEGLEEEITPDIRPSVSKGARTYLEGMSNYGIHTTVHMKEKEKPDGTTENVTAYGVHLASNPYYWVKTQKSSKIKLPEILYNPSYEKITKLLNGGN